MLGRTHIVTTTAMGSAGLYGLHHLIETGDTESWYGSIAHTIVETIGLDFTEMGFPFLLTLAIIYLALIFGSLLPDIDSKESILGRYVPFVEEIFGHRKFIHTIWIVLVLMAISNVTGFLVLWFITIGYFLHLFQDSLSIMSVHWFYPIVIFPRKRGFYRVGGVIETLIFALMIGLNIYMLYLWFLVLFI